MYFKLEKTFSYTTTAYFEADSIKEAKQIVENNDYEVIDNHDIEEDGAIYDEEWDEV